MIADERGQALVAVLLALGLFMLGALGLGIDGAQMYAHRQMAQTAADAAAQAAILSILRGTNTAGAHAFSTAASFTCSTADVRTPCVYARDNGFGSATDAVAVSFPASVSGVTLQAVTVPAVTVTVKRTLNAGFIAMLGVPSWTIGAKATAAIVPAPPSSCVYVLAPSSTDAFTADTQAAFSGACPISIDSDALEAAITNNSATVTASAISITGGYQQKGGGTFSVPPSTGHAAVADPLTAVPEPAVGFCDYTNYQLTAGSATLTAGTYCGGIRISGGATVKFSAGTYVIQNGPLSVDASTVTGSSVTFYLTNASVSITNKAKATLSAPATGAYLGMLFFQDRSVASPALVDNSTAKFTGTLYFPGSSVAFNDNAVVTGTAAIVAGEVSFQNHASVTLTYDLTGAKTGIRGSAAAGLVE